MIVAEEASVTIKKKTMGKKSCFCLYKLSLNYPLAVDGTTSSLVSIIDLVVEITLN